MNRLVGFLIAFVIVAVVAFLVVNHLYKKYEYGEDDE